MASSSAGRAGGAGGRIRNSVSSTLSDNQSLLADIRKSISLIKDLAVDFEKQNQTQKVKELENAVVELLNASEKCQNFSVAAHSVGENYQPQQELTDFKKLLEDEMLKAKGNSSSDLQNHPFRRQFKEAIWNVHHAGQPMPGEEQEDIVMTSTQCTLLNTTCPLSGKPIIELSDPVRSVECKHIYDKAAIMRHIKLKNTRGQCPVAGCPKILQPRSVVCDPLLRIEIEELRAVSKGTSATEVIEDFTELDDGEDD